MSSLKIEERFTVNAPVERVWRYLLAPEQIVVCLPGAQLLEVENERTYHGQMKVKVGPVTVAYKGKIELMEVDEAARRIRMSGKGNETGGTGTAKMDMNSQLVAQEGGGTEVVVQADVQLAGRIVRFGRGMIQGVAEQLFKQFAEGVRGLVESEQGADEGGAGAAGVAEGTAGEGAAAAVTATEPAAQETAQAVEAVQAVEALQPAEAAESVEAAESAETAESAEAVQPIAKESAETVQPAETGEPAGAAEPAAESATERNLPAPAPAATMRKIESREVEPIRALPLLLKALWSSITGFFGKLFGRKR